MRNDTDYDWTDATIATLRRLWSEGHSTAEIGRRMGISKNAVVGKAHRLDLPGRQSPIKLRDPSAPKPERRPRRRQASRITLPRLHCLAAQLSASLPPGMSREVTAAPDLRENHAPTLVTGNHPCCWPIGMPGTSAFRFCDAPALRGKPYCPEHAELAYVRLRDHREDVA